MKRFINILLVVIILSQFLGVVKVNAQTYDVQFEMESKKIIEKEEVEVVINASCEKNFVALNMDITYDSSKLEYKEYQKGSLVTGDALIAVNDSISNTIKLGYVSNVNNFSGKSGEFLKLKFKVKEGAAPSRNSLNMNVTTLNDAENNKLSSRCTPAEITVIEGIYLSSESLNLDVGDSQNLTVRSNPTTSNILDEIVWENSQEDIVTISNAENGVSGIKITANKPGTSVVTATFKGKTASCEITVNEIEPVWDILISKDYEWSKLPLGQIRNLNAYKKEENNEEMQEITDNSVTWSSSDTSVLSIDSSTGEMQALKKGTATITAEIDEEHKKQINIVVDGDLGDIDGDENITAYDAYKALELATDKLSGNNVSEDSVVILDVDRDKDISSQDAYVILKYSVNLITQF